MGAQRVEHADYSFSVDTATGTLARLSVGGECLVYRAFSALRDEHWSTPEPRTSLVESRDRFVFAHEYGPSGYGLEARTVIDHDPDQVRLSYTATVTEPFQRNRLGLCLLLPATLAGAGIEKIGSNGRVEHLQLPRLIAPHQPCTDIATLSFVVSGAAVRIAFSGDVFEMEDQRNWTDFSFKVYGTPLALPFPVRLETGDRVEQSITIGVARAGEDAAAPLRWGRSSPAAGERHTGRMPAVGSRVRSDVDEARRPAVALPLDYYRIDVEGDAKAGGGGSAPDHHYHWAHDRGRAGVRMGDRAIRVIADPTSAEVSPGAPGAGMSGTDAAFAELNRSRPAAAAPEMPIVFTASPQVHDRDDETVVDNLFGLRATLASVKALYPGHPFGLGLLELTPHFNPAAGDLAVNRAIRRADPRQETTFALVWALAALCEAAAAGCSFVTIFDTSGAYGWEADGRLLPAAHLLFDLAEGGFTGAAARGAPAVRGAPAGRGTRSEVASIEILLPPESLSAPRRFALRRRTVPRAAIAANAGLEPWEADPVSLAGGAADAWRIRAVGPDAAARTPAEFRSFRRTSVHEVSGTGRVVLPPGSYLFLKEYER